MTTCRIEFLPAGAQVRCPQGTLLYYAARDAGIALVSVCGGAGSCGRCKVIIERGAGSTPTPVEQQKLSAAEIASGYRLACQTRVQNDLTVYIPPLSIPGELQTNLACEGPGEPVDPVVQDVLITLRQPRSLNHSSCWERFVTEVKNSSGIDVTKADLPALRQVPAILDTCGGTAQACIRAGELIAAGPPGQNSLGVAIDLGTTKIAAYLIDMLTGKLYSAAGKVNPQCIFGDDVMSRIACAMEHGSAQLRQTIIDGLNQLIKELCQDPHKIIEMVIVGNTAMHHLVLELPVHQLGSAPYIPAIDTPLDVKARDLGLDIAPGAYVHMAPNVAGFIGGDHVAMVLATGIYNTPKTVLGIDIGTNTEIVLACNGTLRSTSCASGPAFEGGHITCGIRAISGAIEKIKIQDGVVEFQTIRGMPPIGLCGSGILDAVAELTRCGIITHQGRLVAGPAVLTRGNAAEFVLVPREKSGTGKDITITQQDILEVQLAKAAIRTGIEVLLVEANAGIEVVEEIILTGEFGTQINPASCIAIGMFPLFPKEQFRMVGNAAGLGAMRILISKAQRTLAHEIAQRIQYLELMTYPGFHKQFASALYIPTK